MSSERDFEAFGGNLSKLEYRPDVDGLRTIAVLPVVLFHFGMNAFSGGFVGVDVFFVISGYLITRLILHEIGEGSFSFARFYERRARRLFPAMFVTVVVTLLAGQFLLLPDYLRDAAGSGIFAVSSLSNIFFWTQSGYFETGALTKPLLHTWSLSVEEQFYLVWPAALVFLAPRFGKTGVLGALIIAGIVSLLGAEFVMRSDASAAFYLTPFRIVEFAVGAGVLWIEQFFASRRILLELCLLAGLALIGYAVFSFTEATLFPGLSALIPSLGAALAIAGGRAPTLGLMLRNPVCKSIGLISYSVYLIHWPLAVFFDAYFFREPSLMEQVGLIATTLLIAAVVYRYVETPFRKPAPGRRLSAPAFGLVCALLAMLVILPASIQWSSREASDEFASITRGILSVPAGILGATPAYAQEPAMISTEHLNGMDMERSQALRAISCNKDKLLCGEIMPGKTNVLVVGDSHGTDGYNMLSAGAFPEINVLVTRSQGCAPFNAPANDAECTAENGERAEIIKGLAPDLDYILVHIRITPQRPALLAAYVKELTALGPKIVVMGASPTYDRELPDLYRRAASASDPFPDFSANREAGAFDVDAVVKSGADAAGVTFIDRQPFYCPGDVCSDYTPSKGDLVTIDRHHMSWGAAAALGEYVRQTYPGLFD